MNLNLNLITNNLSTFEKGKFLGKGIMSKVYLFTNLNIGKIYAGKIIPKNVIVGNNKKLLSNELKIHASFTHENICKFIE